MQTLTPTPPTSVVSPLDCARALLALLRAETKATLQEREAYQRLDATALIARLSDRAAFTEKAERLTRNLEQGLVGQVRDDVLTAALAEVRRASKALYTLEQENRALIVRTKSVVGAVIDAVAPAAQTYNLQGQARARPIAAYARVSRRV